MTEAAVAIVVRQRDEPELLFIERVRRPGRRWSGDVAFPGGLAEPGDADLVATAVRESREEVGLELGRPMRRLRRVWTVRPKGWRPMSVTPFVFSMPDGQTVQPSPAEVADVLWVPLSVLRERRRSRLWKRFGGLPVPFPAVPLDGRVLWGLTLQMVQRL